MLVDRIEGTTIITQEKQTINELVKKTNSFYNTIKGDNLIINLDGPGILTDKDIIKFVEISNIHKTAKHSFVLVTSKIDIDEAPEELVIVPTLQEAHDIIEMEEMERDLGF